MTEYILWADVETTGLDYHRDNLLEIAAVVTNKSATEEYGTFESVIYYSEFEAKIIRTRAVDFVRNMHDNTGLWDRLPEGENISSVDLGLYDFIFSLSPEPRKTRLAGNSVRLDLNFMEENLPVTYSHLHYRSIDVSALAYTLSDCWGVVDGYFRKEKKHTAIDDIRESIAEYRWLKAQLDTIAEKAWRYDSLD